MADGPNVDTEARKMAQEAIHKIQSHEQFCEHRGRQAEKFEGEMRAFMERIHNRVDEVHKRLNTLLVRVLYVLLGVLGTAAIGVVVFVLEQLVK